MNLTERLRELVSACFTGVWIESHEQHDALSEIAALCRDEQWRLATWDIDRGLEVAASGEAVDATDPLAAIRSLNGLVSQDGTALLVMKNLHRFIQSTEVMQAIERQLVEGKQNRTILIALSPTVQIPSELEKMFVVVEHAMPDRDQLKEIATGIATAVSEFPVGAELERVLDAASGLTLAEAESAFSLSLVRHGELKPNVIWELKAQMLKKSGLLEMYRGEASFESLGGLDSLKSFCKRALGRSSNVNARGVMLLSPPGCGKSQFCKALGAETGRPVILLDVGSLMGSLVGQTEQRTRQALQIIDAMAPAIVMLDEIDKAFAGVSGSGQSDSGVSARMFGGFLSWLHDRESDTFVVCTANDVTTLPPEFARAERFDSIFFVDLPTRDEKDLIWEQYIERYGLDASQSKPKDNSWTGAEIKAACRLSALLDTPIKAAANNVVPVAATAAESIEGLRNWATGRCIDASKGGLYSAKPKSRSRRKVKVAPSLN